MTRALRVEGRVWLPEKHRDLAALWVAAGLPYSAELERRADGRFIVRLSFDLGEIPAPDLSRGALGLEANPDGVSRMASNFLYAGVVEAVIRRSAKERVGYAAAPARHTSTIGLWKYADRYAVPVHCAAAQVVARRALGYRERVTDEIKEKVAAMKKVLAQRVRPFPREGRGMTRKARAVLERLDGKLLLHNGLCRWRQEGWSSVWSDLKVLALALR